MKILKKALISLSIILLNTTNVYATTTGTYVAETDSGVGKFFLLLVAIGLVALVLFVGYKMDKNEAQEKRKEKIIKQRDNDINDINSKIYSSYDNKAKEYNNLDEVEVDDDEYAEMPEVNFAPETEVYFKETETEEINEEIEEADTSDDDEIDAYSSLKNEISDVMEEDEDDGYDEEEDVYESEDFGETQVISLEEEEEKSVSDSTMVFDVGPLKDIDVNMDVEEKIINKISDVKGYDYEDNDLELMDLEQTIAEANIKKYKRDKNQEIIKVKRQPKKTEKTKKEEKSKKTDNNVKKYTRRKNEKETEKEQKIEKVSENKVKRYTAKKSSTKVSKKEENEEVKNENKQKKYKKVTTKKEAEEKPKRGRKKAAEKEVEEKPKRGRKPATKKETEEKPKRGRKPSTKK